jgi:hypothetical protein
MGSGGPVHEVDSQRLNRRAFLLLLFGAGLGMKVLDKGAEVVTWESVIRAGLPLDDVSIWALGSHCSDLLNGCSTFPEILGHLRPCPAVTWVAAGARSGLGKRRVLERLTRLIAEEYAAAETVIVDRWLLSRTEAALCAAAAIRAREGRA